MAKLSAIIITRNDSDELKECIRHLSFCDEVVVIDNKSTDLTLSIAKDLKAKTYTVSGLDFSYLRNVGKEKSTGEWILYIDTDERISSALRDEILSFIKKPGEFSSGLFVRKNYFFGQSWPHSDMMTRLMKKDALIGWQGQLHETPLMTGNSYKFKNPLLHYTHDDISKMVEKTNEWSEIEAQLRVQNNHPRMNVMRFMRIILTGFFNSYINDEGYKAGTVGFIESIYQSFSMFITYAKLWEKQNKDILSKKKI